MDITCHSSDGTSATYDPMTGQTTVQTGGAGHAGCADCYRNDDKYLKI